MKLSDEQDYIFRHYWHLATAPESRAHRFFSLREQLAAELMDELEFCNAREHEPVGLAVGPYFDKALASEEIDPGDPRGVYLWLQCLSRLVSSNILEVLPRAQETLREWLRPRRNADSLLRAVDQFGGLLLDPGIAALICGGEERFYQTAIARIQQDHAGDVVIPRCLRCSTPLDSPTDEMCLKCGHDWRSLLFTGREGCCPRCGFRSFWDGRECSHCKFSARPEA